MKKLLFVITVCLFQFFQATTGFAQPVITIDTIVGIPIPVVENNNYPLSFTLARHDSDSTTFQGDLMLLIRSETVGVTDTMASFSGVVLGPGQDTILTDSFIFRQSSFDGGDNIVVVWPVSSQSIIPDTLRGHVYFSAIGVDENLKPPLITFNPNPVTRYMRLQYSDPQNVERVRVFDALGREWYAFDEAVQEIDFQHLSSGIYFVEVRNKNGYWFIKKALVE